MGAVAQTSMSKADWAAGLLAEAKDGHLEAFGELIKLHDDEMRALAFSCLGTRNQMDDALQVAYLKAFRNIKNFKGEAKFSTWLHRIVVNSCRDIQRRSSVRNHEPLDESKVLPVDEHLQDQIADHDILTSSLQQLPFEMRAVVTLVDSHGMSYDEAANVLDIPPGTVASRLNRARAALRSLLVKGDLYG